MAAHVTNTKDEEEIKDEICAQIMMYANRLVLPESIQILQIRQRDDTVYAEYVVLEGEG